MQMLKSIKERYQGREEDFVIGNQAQEPVRVDRMRAALQRRSHMCGMDTVTPRMLRDTYAMRAVQAGAPFCCKTINRKAFYLILIDGSILDS